MRHVNQLLLLTARLRQRGSALLVALMVMVGLSLLGLAFVAVSETESAISVTERNHAQAVAVAEASAKEVVQWFQYPQTAQSTQLMPNNATGATWFKTLRVVGPYSGYYKPNTSDLLCDLPYSPFEKDMFFGNEASADIIVTRSTAIGQNFLDNFNQNLLGTGTDPRETGEVTDIRVYAPPLQGGNLVADPGGSGHSFWLGGSRLGVATIAVRVDKYDKPSSDPTRRSIATATCRIVVGKFPLPIPMGPLQSQTALQTQGNFDVSWGLVSAETALTIAKDYETLPWVNSYERIHYERGYDSSFVFQATHQYYKGDIVRPSAARISANPLLKAHEYEVMTAAAAGTSGGTEPAATGAGSWTTAAGGTTTSGTVTFTERYPTAYPITADSTNDTNQPWLWFIGTGTRQIDDPWFQARSAGTITGEPNSNPQPYPFPYANPISFLGGSPPPIPTHHFQGQSFDQYNMYRKIVFPNIDYEFWKASAISGNGQAQVHYLWPVASGSSNYTDGVTTQSFNSWTSLGSGFYFFDTVNRLNPQHSGPGILNTVQNPGSSAWISGFCYLNAPFATTGVGGGGPAGLFTQPGEPYEDIGYREVAKTTTGTTTAGNFITDASGQPVIADAYNGGWNYEDLPWSNNPAGCCSGTPNNQFDVYVAQHTVTPPVNGGSTFTGWFVVPYYPGCKPGNNSCASCNCSEPHEPYLNVIYDGTSMGTAKSPMTIGWQDPTAVAKVAKYTVPVPPATAGTPAGTAYDCTVVPDKCTSNGYDKKGGMVTLSPVSNGVLYNEGQFSSTGNAWYYGSVLVGSGGIDPKGTPRVWYDESLQDGTWVPSGLPRVIITSLQTDQN
jgi:hypothetical protein